MYFTSKFNYISKKDYKFIDIATNLANNSPCFCQHGCVLVQNGKIIGRGYNNYNASDYSDSCNSIHAEVCAIKQYFKVCKFSRKFKEKCFQEK
jgi:deoxycytidylate deaminase